MNNKIFNALRKLAAASLITGVLLMSGCDCDCGGPAMNIRDLIASDTYKQSAGAPADRALDTLVFYLNYYPDLNQTLIDYMTGATEYTLFAPSNAAFASLKATPGFPTSPNALKLLDKQLLIDLLTFHFVEGRRLKSDLLPGMVLNSKFTDPQVPGAPQTITVNADGTLRAAPNAANTSIDIVVADALATNGMIHVVESVMIPPSFSGTEPPLGTIFAVIALNSSFTNMLKVIQAADKDFVENAAIQQYKVQTWLSMPISNSSFATSNTKGLTFFAVPNAAGGTTIFTESAADAIIASPDKGRSFLLNHIVIATATQASGQYTSATPPANNPNNISKFAQGQTITPLSGATKRIFVNVVTPSASVPTGVELSNDVSVTPPPSGSFRIVLFDYRMANGYLQVINGPLN